MQNEIAWAARLAEQHEAQAQRNLIWLAHYRAMMPPGRERRSRLWNLSFRMHKARERAAFWRRYVSQWSTS